MAVLSQAGGLGVGVDRRRLLADLGELDLEPVTSLLAVDQVALSSRATFYAHYPAGNSTPTDQLRQVLALTAGAGYAVAPAAAGELQA